MVGSERNERQARRPERGERDRLRRSHERGARAGKGARNVIIALGAGLVAVAAFFGMVVPLVFGGIVHAAAVVFLGIGGALTVLAAWLAARTDTPGERAVAALFLAGLVGLILFLLWGM